MDEMNLLKEKVYIVIVNYNGWRDTICALESLLRQKHTNHQIFVVDNASGDNSVERIIEWSENRLEFDIPSNYEHLYKSPVLKDRTLRTINNINDQCNQAILSESVILLVSSENRGFAGGNNIAIKFAQSRNDFKYIWLFNNDAIAPSDSLSSLIEDCKDITGSTTIHFNDKESLQCCGGGKINKYLGIETESCSGMNINEVLNSPEIADKINSEIDYISGASFFIKRTVIDNIGLLPEEYFLYWEETDYCTRARRQGFELHWAVKSTIYHKIGASTDLKSENTDYLSTRNSVYYFKKYYFSQLIIIVPILLLGKLINRINRMQFSRVSLIFRAVKDGLFMG